LLADAGDAAVQMGCGASAPAAPAKAVAPPDAPPAKKDASPPPPSSASAPPAAPAAGQTAAAYEAPPPDAPTSVLDERARHRPKLDIGQFGVHAGMLGSYLLAAPTGSDQGQDSTEIALDLIAQIGGKAEATFDVLPPLLPIKTCRMLIEHLDSAHAALSDADSVDDLKLILEHDELEALIGSDSVQALHRAFAGPDGNRNRCQRIRLRRCMAIGKHINWHTDVNLRTMQVALNGDDEYNGGRLLFATKAGLKSPPRPTGAVTIHEHDIVHGVTELQSGVRYGLFLQQEHEA